LDNTTKVKSEWGWQPATTAATITLFVILSVTGLMLLFKWDGGFVKEAHSWLGLVFVLTGVFHMVRHWPSIRHYARGRLLWVVAALTLIATAAFVVPELNNGGSGRGDHYRGRFEARARH
jgi:hypothetical protein